MIEARARVPDYYYDDPNTGAILNALDRTGERFLAAVEDHLQQMDINPATWALPRWEARPGITPGAGAEYEARRGTIMARMRGSGAATPELVRTVADSWKNGAVAVSETAFSVILTFVGAFGIPEDINGLVRAVRAVIPADMLIEYAFRYLLIRDVHNTMTLAQLEETPLDYFAGGNYGEQH